MKTYTDSIFEAATRISAALVASSSNRGIADRDNDEWIARRGVEIADGLIKTIERMTDTLVPGEPDELETYKKMVAAHADKLFILEKAALHLAEAALAILPFRMETAHKEGGIMVPPYKLENLDEASRAVFEIAQKELDT